MTASPSAICGTRRGLTNEATSIRRTPAAKTRSMSASLSAVATVSGSFCSPSRGLTSTNWTSEACHCGTGEGRDGTPVDMVDQPRLCVEGKVVAAVDIEPPGRQDVKGAHGVGASPAYHLA